MTALEEVLQIEKEAEASIEAAKATAAAQIADAKTKAKNMLTAIDDSLESQKKAAVEEQSGHVAKEAEKTETEVAARIELLTKEFSNKKIELLNALKKQFVKK